MTKIFESVINMSITSSYVILAVILLRFFFKKAPKKYSYFLWSFVFFRLVCPFSFESRFSTVPDLPTAQSSINTIDNAFAPVTYPSNMPINDIIYREGIKASESTFSINNLLEITAYIWIIGIAVLLIYSFCSYMKIKIQVCTATKIKDNIYETDKITSAFVLGFFKPKIFIPTSMSPDELNYVICHEQTHIKRLDYLIKPIFYFTVILHWFNPLVWISYKLLTKDMEMSCDELVLKKNSNDIRTDYSQSLLSLSMKQNGLISPLAFGESNVKARVKNVLNYKKPAFFLIILAVCTILIASIMLLSNPRGVNVINITNENITKISWENINGVSGKDFMLQYEIDEMASILKSVRCGKKPMSQNRSEIIRDGDCYIIKLNCENKANDKTYYFGKDYTTLWINDGVKPTLTFKVTNSRQIKKSIEKLLKNENLPMIVETIEIYDTKNPQYDENGQIPQQILSIEQNKQSDLAKALEYVNWEKADDGIAYDMAVDVIMKDSKGSYLYMNKLKLKDKTYFQLHQDWLTPPTNQSFYAPSKVYDNVKKFIATLKTTDTIPYRIITSDDNAPIGCEFGVDKNNELDTLEMLDKLSSLNGFVFHKDYVQHQYVQFQFDKEKPKEIYLRYCSGADIWQAEYPIDSLNYKIKVPIELGIYNFFADITWQDNKQETAYFSITVTDNLSNESKLTMKEAENQLESFLIKNREYKNGSDYLEDGSKSNINEKEYYVFEWRSGSEGIKDRLIASYAISIDGKYILKYNPSEDSWENDISALMPDSKDVSKIHYDKIKPYITIKHNDIIKDLEYLIQVQKWNDEPIPKYMGYKEYFDLQSKFPQSISSGDIITISFEDYAPSSVRMIKDDNGKLSELKVINNTVELVKDESSDKNKFYYYYFECTWDGGNKIIYPFSIMYNE